MKIITRAQWGARPFRTPAPHVPLSSRRWFIVHYPGAGTPPRDAKGYAKWIERIHMDGNGWRGVGYNYLVDADGDIAEGCGRDVRGSHSPPHNVDGIGVNLWTSNGKSTAKAMHAARELYEQLNRQVGRKLRIGWHGMDYPTECPGPQLREWARQGMPDPLADTKPTPTKDWFDMATAAELRKIVREEARAAVDRRVGEIVPAPWYATDADKNPKWWPGNVWSSTLSRTQDTRERVIAMQKMIEAVAKKTGMTADEIRQAAEEGARAALDAKIADATVTLEVKADQ